jgi:hypothetical protein
MLRRHGIAITATTVLALGVPVNVYADEDPKGSGSTDCYLFTCQVEVNVPGQTGGHAGGSGSSNPGGTGGSGSAHSDDEASKKICRYKLADPQPPAGSLDWEGHEPGDGAVYEQECGWGDFSHTISRMVWLAEPPEQEAIDPAVLAQRAVDKMILRGPDIGITPRPEGKGVVGMPVYMWTAETAETYGPNTASASAGGLTVTATAKVKKIVWKMGDGQAVTCTTAGTPYKAAYGKQPSPDCGYRYTQPSSTTATGKYHVTATSTWVIDWQVSGGGPGGQLTEIRNSAVDITVAEVQVLN